MLLAATSADGHLIMEIDVVGQVAPPCKERHVISVAGSNIIGIIKRPTSFEFLLDISVALASSARASPRTTGFGDFRTLTQGHFFPKLLAATGISGQVSRLYQVTASIEDEKRLSA